MWPQQYWTDQQIIDYAIENHMHKRYPVLLIQLGGPVVAPDPDKPDIAEINFMVKPPRCVQKI